ncbi:hypothetical protein AWF33_23990, partial [Escherichia coli]|uniref:hypothetical protein n=1 Tax=Escherichia coli TaxID=562 RepID=UPI0007513853
VNSTVSALFSLFFKQLEVNPLQSIVILNQINENRCCHISDILFLYDMVNLMFIMKINNHTYNNIN